MFTSLLKNGIRLFTSVNLSWVKVGVALAITTLLFIVRDHYIGIGYAEGEKDATTKAQTEINRILEKATVDLNAALDERDSFYQDEITRKVNAVTADVEIKEVIRYVETEKIVTDCPDVGFSIFMLLNRAVDSANRNRNTETETEP